MTRRSSRLQDKLVKLEEVEESPVAVNKSTVAKQYSNKKKNEGQVSRNIVSSSESEGEEEEDAYDENYNEAASSGSAAEEEVETPRRGRGRPSKKDKTKTSNKKPHGPKAKKVKLEIDMGVPVQPELSEYEKQVLKNIEDRNKMLQMLNINEAKASLSEVLSTPRHSTAAKPSKRGFKRKEVPSPAEPLRRSLRARKQPPEFQMSEIEQMPSSLYAAENDKRERRRPDGPISMESIYANSDVLEESARFVEETIPLLEITERVSKLPAETQSFLATMKDMDLDEDGVAKVTKSRIYSLTWHPTNSKLLLAAGDRDGSIAFWDVDQKDDKHNGVRVYEAHGSPVNCISFDVFNPARLLSTSYDGTVRRLDFNSKIFDLLYTLPNPNRTWTAYHAQRDESTLIVAQSDGHIAVLDTRSAPGTVEQLIECYDVSVRTVSVDPLNNNLVMTCSRKGLLGMFDLRKPPKKHQMAESVVNFPKFARGARSAFFSPISGQYVLCTATEDVLKIFDVTGRSGEASVAAQIRHNNFTGRWLTPFKAAWHPQREDVFVVGSMERPRRIQLFGVPSGGLLHNLKSDDYLASVCSINAFHPTLPALCGGNSSGRVHVFRSS